MTKNVGDLDVMIRSIIGATIIAFCAIGIFSGVVIIPLLCAASILMLTSFVSYCPLYGLLKIKTIKENQK